MRLNCIGAVHKVTGSCHLLEVCGKNILIDCGMEQGPDLYENQELRPSLLQTCAASCCETARTSRNQKRNEKIARLREAAKRLLDVVYKSEDIANKDLAKFENQIQNLADKWDRD